MSSRRASTSRSLGLSGPNSIGRGSAVPGGNGKCSVSRNSLSGSGQPLLSWQISAFVYAKVKFQTAPKQNPRVWDGDQPDHGSDAPHVTTSRICAAWKDIPRPAARFQVPSPGVPAGRFNGRRREGGVRPDVFGNQVRVLPQKVARALNLDDDGVAHEPVEEHRRRRPIRRILCSKSGSRTLFCSGCWPAGITGSPRRSRQAAVYDRKGLRCLFQVISGAFARKVTRT